ncbi:hypothetical protein ColKHC_11229 [Colletotrichum higginsianum]|nr:hypothetical protein ColKHC_11229 [Colletotrichum higginsianum]
MPSSPTLCSPLTLPSPCPRTTSRYRAKPSVKTRATSSTPPSTTTALMASFRLTLPSFPPSPPASSPSSKVLAVDGVPAQPRRDVVHLALDRATRDDGLEEHVVDIALRDGRVAVPLEERVDVVALAVQQAQAVDDAHVEHRAREAAEAPVRREPVHVHVGRRVVALAAVAAGGREGGRHDEELHVRLAEDGVEVAGPHRLGTQHAVPGVDVHLGEDAVVEHHGAVDDAGDGGHAAAAILGGGRGQALLEGPDAVDARDVEPLHADLAPLGGEVGDPSRLHVGVAAREHEVAGAVLEEEVAQALAHVAREADEDVRLVGPEELRAEEGFRDVLHLTLGAPVEHLEGLAACRVVVQQLRHRDGLEIREGNLSPPGAPDVGDGLADGHLPEVLNVHRVPEGDDVLRGQQGEAGVVLAVLGEAVEDGLGELAALWEEVDDGGAGGREEGLELAVAGIRMDIPLAEALGDDGGALGLEDLPHALEERGVRLQEENGLLHHVLGDGQGDDVAQDEAQEQLGVDVAAAQLEDARVGHRDVGRVGLGHGEAQLARGDLLTDADVGGVLETEVDDLDGAVGDLDDALLGDRHAADAADTTFIHVRLLDDVGRVSGRAITGLRRDDLDALPERVDLVRDQSPRAVDAVIALLPGQHARHEAAAVLHENLVLVAPEELAVGGGSAEVPHAEAEEGLGDDATRVPARVEVEHLQLQAGDLGEHGAGEAKGRRVLRVAGAGVHRDPEDDLLGRHEGAEEVEARRGHGAHHGLVQVGEEDDGGDLVEDGRLERVDVGDDVDAVAQGGQLLVDLRGQLGRVLGRADDDGVSGHPGCRLLEVRLGLPDDERKVRREELLGVLGDPREAALVQKVRPFGRCQGLLGQSLDAERTPESVPEGAHGLVYEDEVAPGLHEAPDLLEPVTLLGTLYHGRCQHDQIKGLEGRVVVVVVVVVVVLAVVLQDPGVLLRVNLPPDGLGRKPRKQVLVRLGADGVRHERGAEAVDDVLCEGRLGVRETQHAHARVAVGKLGDDTADVGPKAVQLLGLLDDGRQHGREDVRDVLAQQADEAESVLEGGLRDASRVSGVSCGQGLAVVSVGAEEAEEKEETAFVGE